MDGEAWIRLLRLPLCLTVAGDLVAGHALAAGDRPLLLLPAFLVSATLYSVGMAANDLADLEEDRRHRPERPLPAGRIRPRRAAVVVTGLALAALAAPWLLGLPWGAGALWAGLLAAILLYDFGPRHRFLWGPVLLAACRVLDLLCGAHLAGPPPHRALLLPALLYGLYAGALTWLADREGQPLPPGVRLLPLLPLAGLPVVVPLATAPALLPLVLLPLEVSAVWRIGPGRARDRRLTGTWIRGFLLVGGSLDLAVGSGWPGVVALGLWVVVTLGGRARVQS